jgi:hypothetical protein
MRSFFRAATLLSAGVILVGAGPNDPRQFEATDAGGYSGVYTVEDKSGEPTRAEPGAGEAAGTCRRPPAPRRVYCTQSSVVSVHCPSGCAGSQFVIRLGIVLAKSRS